MATYKDVPVDPPATPESIYTQITELLVGAYSVEVIPEGGTVILRVWFEQHCDPAQHQKDT